MDTMQLDTSAKPEDKPEGTITREMVINQFSLFINSGDRSFQDVMNSDAGELYLKWMAQEDAKIVEHDLEAQIRLNVDKTRVIMEVGFPRELEHLEELRQFVSQDADDAPKNGTQERTETRRIIAGVLMDIRNAIRKINQQDEE